MLKNIQVTEVQSVKLLVLMLLLLVTTMMVIKLESDYHLVKEKLFQVYVDVLSVLLLVVVELINQY